MKSCGDCTVCCTGIFHHEVYGQKIGKGVDCRFISKSDDKCAIYEDRPPQCFGFKCLWLSHDSWPDYMKPNISGILAYSNKKNGNHVIYTQKTTEEAKNFVKKYFEERNSTFKTSIYLHPIS